MALTCTDILTQTAQGLYCSMGDFHIDPLRPVPRALVTHGHSDHARAGHGGVLATAETLGIMDIRYGADFAGAKQAIRLGETMRLKDVDVRFLSMRALRRVHHRSDLRPAGVPPSGRSLADRQASRFRTPLSRAHASR